MAEADVLRLVATVQDDASAPLNKISKQLKDLSKAGDVSAVHTKQLVQQKRVMDQLLASTTGYRQAGVHVSAFTKTFQDLGVRATAAGSMIQRSFTPALATMGITGLSATGAVVGLAAAFNSYTKAALAAGKVSRDTGFGNTFVQQMRAVSDEVHLTKDEMDQVLTDLGTKMNLVRTPGGGPLGAGMTMDPQFRQTYGEMQEIMKGADITNIAAKKEQALKAIVDRTHDLLAQGQPIDLVKDKLRKANLDPRIADIAKLNSRDLDALANKKLEKRGGPLDEEAAERQAKAMRGLADSIEGVKNAVSGALIGQMTELADQASRFVEMNKVEISQDLVKFIRNLSEALRDLVKTYEIAAPGLKFIYNMTLGPLRAGLNADETKEQRAKELEEKNTGLSPERLERRKNLWGDVAETEGQAKVNAYLNILVEELRELLFGAVRPQVEGLPQIKVKPEVIRPPIELPPASFNERFNVPEMPSLPEKRSDIQPPAGYASLNLPQTDATKANTAELKALNQQIEEWLHNEQGGGPGAGGRTKVASLAGGLGYTPAGGGGEPASRPGGRIPSLDHLQGLDEPQQGGGGTITPSVGPQTKLTPPAAMEKVNEAAANIRGPSIGDALKAQRLSFADELQNNPAVKDKLFALSKAEVGNNPDAQRKFMETVFNRAKARQQTLDQAMQLSPKHGGPGGKNAGQYPSLGNPAALTEQDRTLSQGALDNVLGGSNRSNLATGNASGRVNANYPTRADSVTGGGRERYVLEQDARDKRWEAGLNTASSTPGRPDLKALGIVDDTGKAARSFPQMKSNPQAIITHHTGGSTLASAVSTLNQRGLGYNYMVTPDGKVHQFVPPGSRGAHILPSDRFAGTPKGLSNENTIGVSAVAKDEKSQTDIQRQSMKDLTAALGREYHVPPSRVFGHGEVNPGHRGKDEGQNVYGATRGMKEWPAIEPGALSAKAAEAQRHDVNVNGSGHIEVDIRAPRGTKTKARSAGMFRTVRLNRSMAGEQAPATAANVNDGSGGEE